MYKPHDAFEPPKDENVRIWRYLDFAKFVALLHTKALFFSRPTFLGDPFEGYYPPSILRDNPQAFQKLYPLVKLFENFLFVNCWHINDYESNAMWKVYLSNNEGLAIQSTYNRLKNSFSQDVNTEVSLGMIKYIDYHIEKFPTEEQMYLPFLHKRREFEHERELRAIASTKHIGGEIANNPIAGINVAIDLTILVEKIVISPYAPSWFTNVVSQTTKNFGYEMEISESRMNLSPYIRLMVTGAVNNPDSYTLLKGSTVRTAIDAAGGITEDADISDARNLDMLLRDDYHLRIPSKNDPKPFS